MTLQQALNHLVAGEHLTRDQMRTVMMQVMTGEATPAQIGAWLVALRLNGETIEEITGAAEVMRELMIPVQVDDTISSTWWALVATMPTYSMSRLRLPSWSRRRVGGSLSTVTDRSPAAAVPLMFWRPLA